MSRDFGDDLANVFISDESLKEVSNFYQKAYEMVFDAFSNDSVSQLKKSLRTFYDKQEKIEALLNVDEFLTGPNLKLYYFFRLLALTDLVEDFSDRVAEQKNVLYLTSKYHHLRDCLIAVGEFSLISGKLLQQKLGMSSSSLYKFIKRIEEYDLFYVQKFGNQRFFSLTPRGRMYLRKIQAQRKETI